MVNANGVVAMMTRTLSTLRPHRPVPGLHLELGPPIGLVAAGNRIRFPLRVENRGRELQEVVLQVESPGDGWTAMIPVRSLALEGDAATVLFLRVDIPADAQVGERKSFRITGAGSNRPDRASILVAECVVDA